ALEGVPLGVGEPVDVEGDRLLSPELEGKAAGEVDELRDPDHHEVGLDADDGVGEVDENGAGGARDRQAGIAVTRAGEGRRPVRPGPGVAVGTDPAAAVDVELDPGSVQVQAAG